MERLSDYLEGMSEPLALIIGFAGAILLAILYALFGAPLAFALLFLLPIALVTFAAGSAAGSAVSIFSSVVWLMADLLGSQSAAQVWLPLVNACLSLALFLGVVYILTQYKEVLKRERECSHEDPLTGIPNLRGFFELAEREVLRARRKFTPISVAYLGLDNLEMVVEQQGKKAAEAILKKLAKSLAGNVRGTDVSARIGEKDFILLMSETGIEGGMKGIRRVNDLLMQVIEEYELPVSFSIGLVTYNILPDTIDQMIHDAGAIKKQVHTPSGENIEHQVVDL